MLYYKIIGKITVENLLLTRHKPTISHWGEAVEPVRYFGNRVVSNLVWLETAKIKVENNIV